MSEPKKPSNPPLQDPSLPIQEAQTTSTEKIKAVFVNDFDLIPDGNLDEELKKRNMEWNSANGFCLNDKGEIAVVFEKEKGYWTLPGGGKEGTETPEDTFLREVKEEAQAEVEKIVYFHCVYGKGYNEKGEEVPHPSNKICFRYICKLKDVKEFISNEGGFEIDQRKFVTLDELPNYITWLKDTPSGIETLDKLKEVLNTF